MKKVIIITMLLTAAGIISLFILLGNGFDVETVVQSNCEQVVKDFTDGKPINFIEKVGENNKKLRDLYSGKYLFEDELYEYIVEPDNLYICRLDGKPGAAWNELIAGQTCTKEDAESIALEVFNKIMLKFFVQGGEITVICKSIPEEAGNFSIDVEEKLNGIPTGNNADIFVSKSGNLLGGVFLKGDPQNINRLINEKDKMISLEAAEEAALKAIKTDPELAAEDIEISDSEPAEYMTIENQTSWKVNITFMENNLKRYASVMVDVFSGEVVKVYLSA